MGLCANEERMDLPGQFQDLHDRVVGVSAGEDQPPVLQPFDVARINLVAVPEAHSHLFGAASGRRAGGEMPLAAP